MPIKILAIKWQIFTQSPQRDIEMQTTKAGSKQQTNAAVANKKSNKNK